MEVCSRNRWTLKKWAQLPVSEKELWVLWNYRRQMKLLEYYDTLLKQEANTPEAVTLIRLALDL